MSDIRIVRMYIGIAGAAGASPSLPMIRPASSGPPIDGETAAAAKGQFCFVGDTNANFLIFVARTLDTWEFVGPAGVIYNEDTEAYERIVVRDGVIQTDSYPLAPSES